MKASNAVMAMTTHLVLSGRSAAAAGTPSPPPVKELKRSAKATTTSPYIRVTTATANAPSRSAGTAVTTPITPQARAPMATPTTAGYPPRT